MAVAAWRKGVAEFIGAFTLIFIGAGAILTAGSTSTSDLVLVALAHGLAIGVMASALAHISGGHFNPAVTLGALVGRQLSVRLAMVYWIAQLLGGVGGALALAAVFPAAIWQPYHLGTPTLASRNLDSRSFTLRKKCLNRFAGCPIWYDSRDSSGEGGGGAKTRRSRAPRQVSIRQTHRDREGSFRHRPEVSADVPDPVHLRT